MLQSKDPIPFNMSEMQTSHLCRPHGNQKRVAMANVLPVETPVRSLAEPLLSTVGNTPLIQLGKIPSEFPGVEILAKAEYFNPGGSVKDRAALNMVLDGERSG